METAIEKHNPLFGRREIRMKIEQPVPPKKEDAAKMVAEKFSAPEETVHIEKIEEKFGTESFIIVADIYSSKEEKDRINTINKKPKKGAKK